jgi:hypothetical protein
MTNMSGQLLLQHGSQTLDNRKDHAKYAVKVVAYEDIMRATGSPILRAGASASSGILRQYTKTHSSHPAVAVSNPESLLFVPHVDSNEPLLLVSRRDSTYIYYYQVEAIY